MTAIQISQQLSLESSLVKCATVKDVAEMWLASLPLKGNETSYCYTKTLENFLARLGKRNIASVRPLDIGLYLKERIKQVSSGTYHHEVNYVRRIFIFSRDNMLISVDPSASFHAPAPNYQKHRPISFKQEAAILARVHPLMLPRLLFPLDTGMRISNVCTLRRESLSFDPPMVEFMVSKSSIRLVLPLSSRLVAAVRHAEPWPAEAWLFHQLNNKRRPMPESTVAGFIEALSLRVGIDFSAHDLRYTFRNRFCEATGSRELTEYCMGHSMKSEIKSYYFTPPTPERLAEHFAAFERYQQAALAKARGADFSEREMWKELEKTEVKS